jgi:hypothetical protein
MIGSSVARMETAQHGLPKCSSPSRSPRRRDDGGPLRAVKTKEAPAHDREKLFECRLKWGTGRTLSCARNWKWTDGAKVALCDFCSFSVCANRGLQTSAPRTKYKDVRTSAGRCAPWRIVAAAKRHAAKAQAVLRLRFLYLTLGSRRDTAATRVRLLSA